MVSCTEFIPLYSELFKFLEEKGGKDAVKKYWEYISDTYVAPRLGEAVEKSGMAGCYDYWSKSLNEEAADFTITYDNDAQEFEIDMHHCPSRGMLNMLAYMDPYYDYCGHCSILYSRVLKRYGIVVKEENYEAVDKAKCLLSFKKR